MRRAVGEWDTCVMVQYCIVKIRGKNFFFFLNKDTNISSCFHFFAVGGKWRFTIM